LILILTFFQIFKSNNFFLKESQELSPQHLAPKKKPDPDNKYMLNSFMMEGDLLNESKIVSFRQGDKIEGDKIEKHDEASKNESKRDSEQKVGVKESFVVSHFKEDKVVQDQIEENFKVELQEEQEHEAKITRDLKEKSFNDEEEDDEEGA
jgi:hypothetical protein